jgi:hypothetical protein
MNCALCLQAKKLCNSHIIPEFMYKPFYDLQHKFQAVHSQANKITFHQSGAKEYLLCRDCEERLNKYETYVSRAMRKLHVDFDALRVGDLLHFDMEYKRGKLFYLSVLWRMSVATTPFFKDFSLPGHNEILRNLILNEDPGVVESFGCSASIPLINGKFRQEWHLNPQTAKLGGDDVCCVVIGGICYIFYLSFNHNPKVYAKSFIQTNDRWLIANYDAKTMPLIDNAFKASLDVLKKQRPERGP